MFFACSDGPHRSVLHYSISRGGEVKPDFSSSSSSPSGAAEGEEGSMAWTVFPPPTLRLLLAAAPLPPPGKETVQKTVSPLLLRPTC